MMAHNWLAWAPPATHSVRSLGNSPLLQFTILRAIHVCVYCISRAPSLRGRRRRTGIYYKTPLTHATALRPMNEREREGFAFAHERPTYRGLEVSASRTTLRHPTTVDRTARSQYGIMFPASTNIDSASPPCTQLQTVSIQATAPNQQPTPKVTRMVRLLHKRSKPNRGSSVLHEARLTRAPSARGAPSTRARARLENGASKAN
jgi:hypothetical protein